jgi:creatinine amidohydrolase
MNKNVQLVILLAVAICVAAVMGNAQERNPLFKEIKIKNYLPHMSWYEVEEALKKTDMVIIPVGSIEQHGKHLPLGTDSYSAVERCKLIAQQADVLVAPTVLAGLSEHHMGFPGSITLSPATFEAVIFETAQSLIHHGFRKIMIYNGHGGNRVSVANVIQKINQKTPATAIFLNSLTLPPTESAGTSDPLDMHAGEGETSTMLYLTNSLVDMARAEKPKLTFPDAARKAWANSEGSPDLSLVASANLFRPKDTGKKASSREMSNIGVFTGGDPKNATAESGRKSTERFVKAAVKFIKDWKRITQED